MYQSFGCEIIKLDDSPIEFEGFTYTEEGASYKTFGAAGFRLNTIDKEYTIGKTELKPDIKSMGV